MTTLATRKKRNGLSRNDNRLLTPWTSPWNDKFFHRTFDDLSKLLKFDDAFKDDFFEEDSLMPAMNVKENKQNFEIEFAAPGFDKNDFEVTIENDILHVSAKKERNEEHKENEYARKEFSYKSFTRSIVLPTSVDLNQEVKATYNKGILDIILLKQENNTDFTTKKTIEVN